MNEPIETIRNVDVRRAARLSLASLGRDLANMNAVIAEANDESGGLVRLLVSLAGQGAVLSARLSPDDPDRYLLSIVDASLVGGQ